MKIFSNTWYLFVIVSALILGCKENENVTITINSTTQRNALVRIYFNRYMEDSTLVESKTDSVGQCSFELKLQRPTFAYIQIGQKYGEVYLAPGDKLQIEATSADYKIPLTFSGKGAEINNYVSWVNSNVEKIKWVGGRGLAELGTNEFLHRFDSLMSTINSFHKCYTDSVSLSDEIISTLEYKNSIKFSAIEEEYKFYKLNNSFNKKHQAHSEGKKYLDTSIDKELESLADKTPLDPVLLTDGYGDYQMLLNFYWQNEINLPVAEQLLFSKDSALSALFISNERISKADYPQEIREFFLAYNFQYWLGALGISSETDSAFAHFKKTYPGSSYLPAMNKSYSDWLAIAPGKPAPEFEGHAPDGKKISLKDLRGKIIYIDVWATWCAPCVAEIPASKKLQQEFANEENIQFLNISVDSRKSDWERFLQEDKTWKGLHIIIDPKKIQSLYSSYKMFGVPAYILIDQSGNIINTKAHRPSEKETKKELQQLLGV